MVNKELLKVDSIKLDFRGNAVLDNVSFNAKDREIFGIIGPNGTGKTSIVDCITMFNRPQAR
jgi:branched-chain amino acid transport system ATP-binding protein